MIVLFCSRRLKVELQSLRRKGALQASTDAGDGASDPDRSCGRCRIELGRVINRGAYCRSCRIKVCKACRVYPFRTADWVCTICHKRMWVADLPPTLLDQKMSFVSTVYLFQAQLEDVFLIHFICNNLEHNRIFDNSKMLSKTKTKGHTKRPKRLFTY